MWLSEWGAFEALSFQVIWNYRCQTLARSVYTGSPQHSSPRYDCVYTGSVTMRRGRSQRGKAAHYYKVVFFLCLWTLFCRLGVACIVKSVNFYVANCRAISHGTRWALTTGGVGAQSRGTHCDCCSLFLLIWNNRQVPTECCGHSPETKKNFGLRNLSMAKILCQEVLVLLYPLDRHHYLLASAAWPLIERGTNMVYLQACSAPV